MQREVREIAIRHGIALLGPNCMGLVDLTTNGATYIGDVNPWLPRGGVAGIAQSGSVTDAFIHSGHADRLLADRRLRQRGRPRRLRLPRATPSTTRRPTRSSCSSRASSGRSGSSPSPTGRSSSASRSWPSRSVGAARRRRRRSPTPARWRARRGRPMPPSRAAGVILCDDLDALLETAELVAGCRRLGRRVGRGRTGVVTVSTGEASLIADLAPRTGIDLPDVPPAARDQLLRRPADARLHRQPARPVGRDGPADRLRRRLRRVRRDPAPTTSSRSSTTSRTARCRPRSRPRWRSSTAARSARPRTGRTSCRSSSR